jgi:hypothetical protein
VGAVARLLTPASHTPPAAGTSLRRVPGAPVTAPQGGAAVLTLGKDDAKRGRLSGAPVSVFVDVATALTDYLVSQRS